jgi:enoyl-CoA hydratase/carnithine racemase
MDAVSAHPFPIVAAINGHCLGGGLELAVRCDLRICAQGAKLGMPPAKLGLIYGHTGLERFIDVIGVAATRDLFLTGRVLDSEKVLRIGLVNELAADDELPGAAVALAAEIAGNAPLSMKGNKHAIEMLARKSHLTDEVERELVELRESCFASEDFREGVTAFAEKRKPVWHGR